MSSSMKYSNGFWKVYVHINKTNKKRYVGITSQKPEYRWNYGRGYNQSPHFKAAIDKYGWDGFEHIVLFDELTEEQAKEKEIELIAKWNTTDKEYGYNVTAGGEALCGYIPTPEVRAKLSKIRTGMKRSDETKRKLAIASKRTYEKSRIPLAEAKYRPVSVFALDGSFVKSFPSITHAANELHLTNAQKQHVSEVCAGRRRSTGGYIFKYA